MSNARETRVDDDEEEELFSREQRRILGTHNDDNEEKKDVEDVNETGKGAKDVRRYEF